MYMAVAAGGLEVKEISLTAASEAERQAELRKEARQARLVEEKSDTRQLLRQMYGPGIYVLTGEVENAFENGGVVGVKKVGRTGVETFDLQIEKGAMTGETLAEWTHEQGWGAGLGWAIGNVVTYSGLALAPMAEVINRLAESEKAVRVINTALALWLAVSGGMPHRAGTGLGKQINRPDQSDITPGKDGPPGWYVTWAAIIAGFLAACRAALAGTPQIPDAGVPTDRPGPGVTVVPRETPTLPPTAGENGVVPATTQPPETCKIDGLQLGSKYPAEVSGLVKPINEWTDSEKQNIVDADGNPIFAGVKAIADSAWATGHGFQVAGTWVGKGCGYGLLFKDVNGNLVWAADGQGQALGRPDGNGIGVGFVTMPGFGGPGEPGLIVGKEQELVWIADGVVVGKADPVRHVWNKLEAAATPEVAAISVDAGDPYVVRLNGVTQEEVGKWNADKLKEAAPALGPAWYYGMEDIDSLTATEAVSAGGMKVLYTDGAGNVQMWWDAVTGEVKHAQRSVNTGPTGMTTVFLVNGNDWTRDNGKWWPLADVEPGMLARMFDKYIFPWSHLVHNYFDQELEPRGFWDKYPSTYLYNLSGEEVEELRKRGEELWIQDFGGGFADVRLGSRAKVDVGGQRTFIIETVYKKGNPIRSWYDGNWYRDYVNYPIEQTEDGTTWIGTRMDETWLRPDYFGGAFVGGWLVALIRQLMPGGSAPNGISVNDFEVMMSGGEAMALEFCGPGLEGVMDQLAELDGGKYKEYSDKRVVPIWDAVHRWGLLCGIEERRQQ